MLSLHVGKIQIQAIDNAIQCLEGVTAKITNREESDVYRLVRPDFDEGLQVALIPYDSLFGNGALPWGDVPTATVQDSIDDLNGAWEDLFSAITKRVADKTALDLARTRQEVVHGIFKNISTASPGSHVPQCKKCEIEGLRSTLSDLSSILCSSDCISGKHKKPRTRALCGRKGPQTKKMKLQLKTFKTFLRSKHYDGIEKRIRGLALQCWKKNPGWEKAKSAKGQNKGYSSSATLANAYLKSKD